MSSASPKRKAVKKVLKKTTKKTVSTGAKKTSTTRKKLVKKGTPKVGGRKKSTSSTDKGSPRGGARKKISSASDTATSKPGRKGSTSGKIKTTKSGTKSTSGTKKSAANKKTLTKKTKGRKLVKKKTLKKSSKTKKVPKLPDSVNEVEVAEIQQQIFDLRTEIENLRDERRKDEIEQNKLERTTKLRKALAIDKHHQKITQIDEAIEDIVDVLYDYEEQLENYSIYVDTSVAELFEDLKADLNEEIKAVAQEGKECTKVIPSINLDLVELAKRKVELQEDLNTRLSKQHEIKKQTDDLMEILEIINSEDSIQALRDKNEKLKADVDELSALMQAVEDGGLSGAKGADPAVLKKVKSKNSRLENQIKGLNNLLKEASNGLGKSKNLKKLQSVNERLQDQRDELQVLLADAATSLKNIKPEVMSPATKQIAQKQSAKLQEIKEKLRIERDRKKTLLTQLVKVEQAGQTKGVGNEDGEPDSHTNLELRKRLADLKKKLADEKAEAKKKRRQSVGGKSPTKVKKEANPELVAAKKERARLKRELKSMKAILSEDSSGKKDAKDGKWLKKLEKTKTQLAKEREDLRGRQERLASQKQQIEELDKLAEAGMGSLGALETKLESMKEKIESTRASKEKRAEEIDALRDKVNRMKKRGRGLKKLGRNFERQVNEIRASSKQVKKDMKNHVKAFTPFLKEQIATMKSLIRKQKEDSKDALANYRREHQKRMKFVEMLEELGCTDEDFAKLDKKVDSTIRKEKRMRH